MTLGAGIGVGGWGLGLGFVLSTFWWIRIYGSLGMQTWEERKTWRMGKVTPDAGTHATALPTGSHASA